MKSVLDLGKVKGLVGLIMFLISVQSIGQVGKLAEADESYSNYSYIEAASIYESVANKGYKSLELFRKLGDSYYLNGRYSDAVKWYGELFALDQNQPNMYNLRYSQSLKATGSEGLAKQYYDKFLSNTDKTGKDYVSVEKYLDLINQNSGRYELEKVAFNSKGIDFGSAYLGNDKIVFSSSRNKGVLINRRSKWDGEPFLDLFEVNIENDSLSEPKKIKTEIKGKYHESTPVFTKDGTTMYFTRTEVKGLGKKKAPLYLKIFRATLVNGEWTNEEDLTINGDTYNTAHPMLNASEDKLYFVSDRKGGEGQTDLYYANLRPDGSLGKMVNLGKKINTPGRESFPFISKENDLYFSSDGHFGLGGYDIFYVKLKGNGYEGNVLNVGKPVNSSFDDICYVVRDHKGYVSSNRVNSESSKGFDNIYSFKEIVPIKQVNIKSKLHGKVTEEKTNMPLANSMVEVLDVNNVLLQTTKTDEKGYYETDVAFEPSYILKVSKEGYESTDYYSDEKQEDREHNFKLEPKVQLKEGTNIAEALNISAASIYFDLDKSTIRPDAEVELQKVVALLKTHPNIRIDIRSHTDSRAGDAYNLTLSDRRAKSTLEYLVNNGINRNRLTARGYGESMLLNNCSNGVKCTETEHQLNRRSEFIIID